MFPEKVVITPLVSSSPEFAAFYEAERPKITSRIRWAQNRQLEYDALVDRLSNGPVIYLRRIPPLTEDAPVVAEELAHLVLDTEGFPRAVALDPHFRDLSTAINSMVQDPLILKRLARYGFELWRFLVPQAEATMKVAVKKRPPPRELDIPVSLLWAVNYASHILEWEVASRIGGARESELRTWLEAELPEIARAGRELLELVERVGYDTPQRTEELMRQIIERYSLTSVISITPPHSSAASS